MRLIPGKTKVKIELFKGVSLLDIAIAAVAMGLMVLVAVSNLGAKIYVCIGIGSVAGLLLFRLDSDPSYVFIMHMIKHFAYSRVFKRAKNDKVLVRRDETDEEQSDVDNEEEIIEEDTLSEKEKRKAEKELFKQEKKILSSKTATKEEKDAVWLARANRSAEKKVKNKQKKKQKAKIEPMDNIIAFTGIKDDFIEYAGEYYGVAIEIPPVEFRFFSPMRRANSIENGVGRVLRTLNPDFSANIVKIDRPVLYDKYIGYEQEKVDSILNSYEKGLISEEELKSRITVLYNRIDELKKLCFEEQVIEPYYYIVLFDADKRQLATTVNSALETLRNAELQPKRLNNKELAVFLKYTNDIDFDERDIDSVAEEDYAQWAMPKSVNIKFRTVEVNNIITHNFRVINYPSTVDDAWMAGLMSMPASKVVIKVKPMDRTKAITSIDRSLQEINDRLNNTGIESRRIELATHSETLSELLLTLQGDNETLLNVNIYVSAYDIGLTRNTAMDEQPPISLRTNISNMKKTVRRMFTESGIKLENMDFNQIKGYIGSQVSGYDPMFKDGRGIPSNSVAAAYPWVFANVCDEHGTKVGFNDDVPVFVDFFRRDSERVNSNMVIVGKSGSGKSYATKSILTNLAGDDTKIFILDPENEYSALAKNLNGKIINVGNASQGRLNPFQIITSLDDEDGSNNASGSYSTHLQFLEEFFKQSLTDCDKDALEYLNSLVDRTYLNKGITSETNLKALKPEDYPIFDDLYDTILAEFQLTENDYLRTMLRTLMNYISKYSSGGRNASIWNGPSTVTTEENFTVFNFQSLLANRNTTIANSQMLLVLKYIDNEIIKNREYNIRYKTNRKIAVIIDEAHVFIDAKYPIALDFMFQLAKRIRKYNGMQIVITQNIKDFVGSEEIARKSTAIINACQYSFIFSLSPNDIDDLCLLYEKSGGINEVEQEQIVSAARGEAFAILSSQHRSSFRVHVPDDMVRMFEDYDYENPLFSSEEGNNDWDEFIDESRSIRQEFDKAQEDALSSVNEFVYKPVSKVEFSEISGEEYEREYTARMAEQARKEAEKEIKEEIQQQYREGVKTSTKNRARGSIENMYNRFSNELEDDQEEYENPYEYSFDTEDSVVEFSISEDDDDNSVSFSFEEETEESSDNLNDYSDTAYSGMFTDSQIDNDSSDENEEIETSETVRSNPTATVKTSARPSTPSPKMVQPNIAPNNQYYQVPQIVMQAPAANDKLDEAVSKLADVVENMGKMNYESIMSEVRRMVGNGNVNTSNVDSGNDFEFNFDTDFSQPNEDYNTESEIDTDNTEQSIDDLINELLNGSSDDSESDDLFSFALDEDEEETESTANIGNSDIPSFLFESKPEESDGINPIDKLLESDETIVVATLEDLIAFNLKRGR